MFRIFKKKSLREKINSRYQKLLKEAHALSTINRQASDAKYAEAERLILQLEKIKD